MLTNYRRQRKELLRTYRQSKKQRGTHTLLSKEGGTTQNKIKRKNERHSQEGLSPTVEDRGEGQIRIENGEDEARRTYSLSSA